MIKEDILIPIVVFSSIVMIVKLVLDNRLRNKLIDKGMVDENVKFLYSDSIQTQRLTSLKWGMVLVCIGLALLISYIWRDIFNDEGTLGLMSLFAGLGFLIYFSISQKFSNNNKM